MFSGGGATCLRYSGGVVCAAAMTAVLRYLSGWKCANTPKPAANNKVVAIRMNLRRRNVSSSAKIDKEFDVLFAISLPPNSAYVLHDLSAPRIDRLRSED